MKARFVTLFGGPLDGETRVIHEGNKLFIHMPNGVVHAYLPSREEPGRWEYDIEASTIETLRSEQRRRKIIRDIGSAPL